MKNFRGIVTDIMEHRDMVPLAEGLVTYDDFTATGVNRNCVIVGSTGSGKSVSFTESRLLHTFDSSIVAPVSKRAVADKYASMFRGRGYRTHIIDFNDASMGDVGYDPMDYVKNHEDACLLARKLGGFEERKTVDSFWDKASESLIAAVILLIKLNAEYDHKPARFMDVIEMLKCIEYVNLNEENEVLNIKNLFDEANVKFPGNTASELIKAAEIIPPRTSACMMSNIRGAIQNCYSEIVMNIVTMKDKVRLDELGDEKTVLFVITNPFNDTCAGFVNIMYIQMFKSLFEKAEHSVEGHLDIPVHVICDDFACSGKITGFDRYVSIFRQAGMSVTILLQSESQLESLYDRPAATTILNNMDTYVFTGSLDETTVRSISRMVDLPFDRVMHMPLEQVMVIRRGCKPHVGRRYQTYDDPIYRKLGTKKEFTEQGSL